MSRLEGLSAEEVSGLSVDEVVAILIDLMANNKIAPEDLEVLRSSPLCIYVGILTLAFHALLQHVNHSYGIVWCRCAYV